MALKLPRLFHNWEKQPRLFERYWEETVQELEKVINQILQIPVIQEGLALLNASVATVETEVASLQGSMSTEEQMVSILGSYIERSTPVVLEAAPSGIITIYDHTRVYANPTLNPPRFVAGGSLATGAAVGSVIRVYYNDPARAGGNVTYHFTVDPAPVVPQSGDAHSVGAVIIPVLNVTEGAYLQPPGYIYF